MPPLTLCTYLQIFILFFILFSVFLFLFFSLPLCVPESVLHSLNLIGLTLQMKHFCHICQEVWFEWNFNIYKFSDIVNAFLSCLQLFITWGGAWPWRGVIRPVDLRSSENPLLYNHTYEITCAGSPKGSVSQRLWYHAAEEQIISPGLEV